jgi:hypothetical protein
MTFAREGAYNAGATQGNADCGRHAAVAGTIQRKDAKKQRRGALQVRKEESEKMGPETGFGAK